MRSTVKSNASSTGPRGASKGRQGLTAGTASSNRHSSKQQVNTAAPTKEALQMLLREFDFRTTNWAGVEAKFRELNGMLSAPTSGLNAAQERIQQKENVSSAIVTFLDMCQAECRRLLAEGDERSAVEGGLATLGLKREYYGNTSLQLVSAFFHLARTNQCLGHIKRSEEFLSLAQLQIMKHPEADDSLKAEMHQIYGLLYASDGRQDQALKHLTCAAYYLSCLNGPENILTSFCYFDIGNVFAALNHMENTMSFYEKVKDIWYVFLSQALQRMLEVDRQVRAADDEEIAAAIAQNAEKIMAEYATSAVGSENVQDAGRMLQAIVGLQRERMGVVHPQTARSELILGMLLLWVGERTPAYETLVRAHEISRRSSGERHEVTTESATLLRSFGMELPSGDEASMSVDELVRDLEMQRQRNTGGSSGGGDVQQRLEQQQANIRQQQEEMRRQKELEEKEEKMMANQRRQQQQQQQAAQENVAVSTESAVNQQQEAENDDEIQVSEHQVLGSNHEEVIEAGQDQVEDDEGTDQHVVVDGSGNDENNEEQDGEQEQDDEDQIVGEDGDAPAEEQE